MSETISTTQVWTQALFGISIATIKRTSPCRRSRNVYHSNADIILYHTGNGNNPSAQTLPRQISDGYNCKKSEIESIVMSSCHSIDESPGANIVRDLRSESAEDFQTRKISLFRRHRAAAIDEFTNTIMNMWPSRAPAMTRYDGLVAVSQYADVQKALIFASALFESWYGNKCFFEYLTEIETMLGRLKETQTLLGMTCQDIGPTGSWQPWRVKHAQPILRRGLVSIDDIFASLAPFHVPFSGTDLTDF